jgi:hypothetical protein
MTQISHDSFARTTLVRTIVPTPLGCDNCGNYRERLGQVLPSLFQYSTVRDDSGRYNKHKGLFCSKVCHDAYHI